MVYNCKKASSENMKANSVGGDILSR